MILIKINDINIDNETNAKYLNLINSLNVKIYLWKIRKKL